MYIKEVYFINIKYLVDYFLDRILFVWEAFETIVGTV